jgi:hypothetical protein
MTRAKISEYSATANDNTDVNGTNIAEGCHPSSMNNMGREIMAALKRFQVGSDGDGVTVGGALVVSGATTANTISATIVNASGNATVGGTLVVTGATTFSGNVILSGTTTANTFSTDLITEKTSAAGVTIDSVLLKDGLVNSITVGRGGGAVSTNTAVGASALNANTTGATGTAVGFQAGFRNTTGSSNTSVGHSAGFGTLTGTENVFVGQASGPQTVNDSSGSYNTALGAASLRGVTSGSYNTAVGYQTLYANTTASNNTAVGNSALNANTTGAENQAFGTTALFLNTTGSNNTAVGRDALRSNTTADNNTAVGYQAGYANTTGTFNTALGYQALDSNTTGNSNTAIGRQAGATTTTASGSTFVGDFSGNTTTGGSNTFVGNDSGYLVTTGAKNTIIGRYNGNQDGLDFRTESNNIVLSDGDGNVRMHYRGADASWKSLAIYNNTSGSAANMVVLASGTIARSTSSLKYKRDVQDATHGLAEVLQLRSVTYKGKSEKDGDTVFGGLIAEEVHDAGLTEFVQYAADGTPDALAYGNMVSICVKAIQELSAQVTALQAEVNALKGQ